MDSNINSKHQKDLKHQNLAKLECRHKTNEINDIQGPKCKEKVARVMPMIGRTGF